MSINYSYKLKIHGSLCWGHSGIFNYVFKHPYGIINPYQLEFRKKWKYQGFSWNFEPLFPLFFFKVMCRPEFFKISKFFDLVCRPQMYSLQILQYTTEKLITLRENKI